MRSSPIRSFSDPARPEPWAELVVADGSLDVTVRALNGLEAYKRARGEDVPPGWKRRPEATAHTLARSPSKPDETHVLAVTLDGDLEFVPQSEQRPVYYAHLAWWDPATGEWTVLEFVEG